VVDPADAVLAADLVESLDQRHAVDPLAVQADGDAALELDFAGVIVSHMLQAILLAAVGVSAVWQIVGQSLARAKTMADDIS